MSLDPTQVAHRGPTPSTRWLTGDGARATSPAMAIPRAAIAIATWATAYPGRRRSAASTMAKWGFIFGNGFGSTNGTAGIFIGLGQRGFVEHELADGDVLLPSRRAAPTTGNGIADARRSRSGPRPYRRLLASTLSHRRPVGQCLEIRRRASSFDSPSNWAVTASSPLSSPLEPRQRRQPITTKMHGQFQAESLVTLEETPNALSGLTLSKWTRSGSSSISAWAARFRKPSPSRLNTVTNSPISVRHLEDWRHGSTSSTTVTGSGGMRCRPINRQGYYPHRLEFHHHVRSPGQSDPDRVPADQYQHFRYHVDRLRHAHEQSSVLERHIDLYQRHEQPDGLVHAAGGAPVSRQIIYDPFISPVDGTLNVNTLHSVAQQHAQLHLLRPSLGLLRWSADALYRRRTESLQYFRRDCELGCNRLELGCNRHADGCRIPDQRCGYQH